MKEIWKPIPNTKHLYEASSYGNIRSLRFGKCKLLKLSKNGRGYLSVGIFGKVYNVHRLILMTFNPMQNADVLVVNHKDFDKTNNHLENLEWCTQKYNIWHAQENGHHKAWSDTDRKKGEINRLKSVRKRVLCVDTNEIFESITAAAKAKNTHVQSICHCCNKKLNSAGGYRWEYAA